MKGKYKTLSLDRILDPEQPLRGDINPESVKDLSVSIKQIGIINPLVVKKSGKNYELVAGHRRLVAAGIAGLTQAPCIIVEAEGITSEIIKLQENLVRDDINPIEWANHLAFLKKQYKITNAKIAETLGMSESWVIQHLQILEYPPRLLEALKNNKLAFTSARELVQIRDTKKRDVYVNHAVRGGVTPTLAARWKREANQEPLEPQEPIHTPEEAPSTQTDSDPQPECAICAEPIKPEDELRLIIHSHCGPEPATK